MSRKAGLKFEELDKIDRIYKGANYRLWDNLNNSVYVLLLKDFVIEKDSKEIREIKRLVENS